MAFKTNKNSPNVRKIKGKVKNPRIGLNIAFKIPKTTADIAALPKLLISTPIGNLEIIKKLSVVTNQETSSPIMAKTPILVALNQFTF